MPNSDAHSADHATSWQGVSGRLYGIVSESLDGFTLRENHLYLIAGAKAVLWVGSTAELVADPLSRTRFRRALGEAQSIIRLTAQTEEGERLSTIVDLEGGGPAASASAQAA
jgi:hypothetical protein